MTKLETQFHEVLKDLSIQEDNFGVCTGKEWLRKGKDFTISHSPINGKEIGKVRNATLEEFELVLQKAEEAFCNWKKIPAPQRGEIVRQIANALREKKESLGKLVSIEAGKILSEGAGEVQEMIDICDFAVGQSRLINGYMLRSERKEHRLFEQYHPLGIVGIITSFNFPVAVWAWNTMIAAITGNVVVWKPSSKTPLTAIATQKIVHDVLKKNNVPEGVFNLVIGRSSVIGDNFLNDKRINLVSMTGSTKVGRHVAELVSKRFGKTILELGGNNAAILAPSANLHMALQSIIFGSVGTAGQRCTSTRRLIVHQDIYEEVKQKLLNAYGVVSAKIGNPMDEDTLIGPLIDEKAVQEFTAALRKVEEEGGKVLCGGAHKDKSLPENGYYVKPALVEAQNHMQIVQEETFAPILYIMKYKSFDEAIKLNNAVPQGLSSALFTNSLGEYEQFISECGSDCGIANVNAGTSGAEIGGAFGGEKETGGGRESGSDAWKAYMRRQTSTVNFGNTAELAQGVKFDF